MFRPSSWARTVVLLLAVVALTADLGCAREEEGPTAAIGVHGPDGRARRLDGPIAVGSEIELVVTEPDPDEPHYGREARVAEHHVAPADAVRMTTHPVRRHLVMTALAAGEVHLTVTTASGHDAELRVRIEEPRRLELASFAAPGGAFVDLPDDLQARGLVVAGGAKVGFEVRAYDAAGVRLAGHRVADWTALPSGVLLEPWAAGTDRVRVASAPPGEVTVRATPRASAAARSAVAVSFTAVEQPPVAAELRAYRRSCAHFACDRHERIVVVGERATVEVSVGRIVPLELHLLDGAGQVILTEEAPELTIDAGDAGVRAPALFTPNLLLVGGERPGTGRIDVAYAGRRLAVDVRVLSPSTPPATR